MKSCFKMAIKVLAGVLLLGMSLGSVYFSPNGGAKQALVELIGATTADIDVAMYSFTSKELGLALAGATQKGRRVRIVADNGQSAGRSSVLGWLSRYAQVHLMHEEGERGMMHHKFMVIGDRYLTTGSYNWSINAEKFNNENLLILKDSDLISEFKREFGRLWEHSRPYAEVRGTQ